MTLRVVYTPEPSSSEIDHFLDRLLTCFNRRADARMKASALDDTHFVETYLINSGDLQAYAGFQAGIHTIDIHLGTIFLLRDLFDQVLSHPRNFPHVGRADRERARHDYKPIRQALDLSTIAVRHWQPQDLTRATVASNLALAILLGADEVIE